MHISIGDSLMLWNRRKIKGPVEFDIISAIWILACTDQDPLITYRGIVHRLDTEGLTEADVRSLVRSRAELFSTVISNQWLYEWQRWIIDESHYPRWIIDEFREKHLQTQAVETIKREDVFRSQLRTYDKQGPCDIEQTSWGIEHIDRLRKANVEARQQRLSMWTGFIVPVFIPLATILASYFITRQTLENATQMNQNTTNLARQVAKADERIKLWDLAAKGRGDSYPLFMESVQGAFDAALRGDRRALDSQLKNVRSNYYKLEQEVENEKTRSVFWLQVKNFSNFCLGIVSAGRKGNSTKSEVLVSEFENRKENLHKLIYSVIFVSTPNEDEDLNLLNRRNAISTN